MEIMPIVKTEMIKQAKNVPQGVISRTHAYLNKAARMSIKSVSKMSEKAKTVLRANTPRRLRELAELNCYGAEKIKERLDMEYGENNYVLIAVGRSISSMAELLKHMGVDAKIIPLSGLRHLPLEFADITRKKLAAYSGFLKSIGLNKSILYKNSDKKYVVMDYAFYGRSLDRAVELLKYDDLLGKAENIEKKSVNEVLGEDYISKNYCTLFEFSRFKDYAYVGRLPVTKMEHARSQSKPEKVREYWGNITQGLRKLFWFNVFDSYINQTYKNCSSALEINAIKSHHLSEKAIKNRIKRQIDKNNKLIRNLSCN